MKNVKLHYKINLTDTVTKLSHASRSI